VDSHAPVKPKVGRLISPRTADADDDYVIALAQTHGVDAVVSGDRHLLDVASSRNELMEDRTKLGTLRWHHLAEKSRRCRLASTMTVPALDSCSGACSTRKCSPSTT
jgi:predicted nucleic acid-binding protein